jgi:hypothetical protein
MDQQIIEVDAEIWRGMRDYLAALHKYQAVDEFKMKFSASYLPLEECLKRWQITPIK